MLTSCPHCKHSFKIEDTQVGTIVACFYCGKRFRAKIDEGPDSSAGQANQASEEKKTPRQKPMRRGSKDISFTSSPTKPSPAKKPPSYPPLPRKKKGSGCGCSTGCLTTLAIIAAIIFAFYYYVILPKSQLPKHLLEAAKVRQQQLTEADQKIKERHKAYLDFKKTEAFGFFASYAEHENWEQMFTDAVKIILAAQSTYDTKAKPLLKRNKKEDAGQMGLLIMNLVKEIHKAQALSKTPDKRISFIKKTKETAPEMVAKAEAQFKTMPPLMAETNQLIAKAQTEYPNRSEDIIKRTEPVRQLLGQAKNALSEAEAELQNHLSQKQTDYARLGDQAVAVGTLLEEFKSAKKDADRQLNELFESYSKVLADMRIDYFLVVKRESWDNYYDYPTSHFYLYPPKQVSGDVYVAMTQLNPEYTVQNGYWNTKGQIFKVPARENWSSGDDDAVYWIEEAYFKTYHKYTIVNDKGLTHTNWIEVDEDLFEDHYTDLGMEIAAKPFGYFEDEKITKASPPGMAFVGNPRYGSWQKDPNTGQRFWIFAGSYLALSQLMAPAPHNRYYKNDWDLWRSHYKRKKPFYGALEAQNTEQIYGTGGAYVRTSGYYQRSNFARKGHLRQAAASIRSAGPGRRGRGPAGFGK